MRHLLNIHTVIAAGAVALASTICACAQLPVAVPFAAPPAATQPAAPGSLAGTWMATGYTCPGSKLPPEEQIKITQYGTTVTATKVVGDDCVPSGAMTWQGTVTGYSFPVQVQVSSGPRTPLYLRPATVTLTGPETLQVSAGWVLKYRRVGP